MVALGDWNGRIGQEASVVFKEDQDVGEFEVVELEEVEVSRSSCDTRVG